MRRGVPYHSPEGRRLIERGPAPSDPPEPDPLEEAEREAWEDDGWLLELPEAHGLERFDG